MYIEQPVLISLSKQDAEDLLHYMTGQQSHLFPGFSTVVSKLKEALNPVNGC
jgi:hypothetical protein